MTQSTQIILLGAYPSYFETYISKVPDKPIWETLCESNTETIALINSLKEDLLLYKYQSNKWTIKEIVQHIIDTERIFCYRALSFARGETISLPGYDHDEYVRESNANKRTKEELEKDLQSVRSSTLELFKSFTSEMMTITGVANEKTISVSAILYIIAGHEIHHRSIIKERYL